MTLGNPSCLRMAVLAHAFFFWTQRNLTLLAQMMSNQELGHFAHIFRCLEVADFVECNQASSGEAYLELLQWAGDKAGSLRLE